MLSVRTVPLVAALLQRGSLPVSSEAFAALLPARPAYHLASCRASTEGEACLLVARHCLTPIYSLFKHISNMVSWGHGRWQCLPIKDKNVFLLMSGCKTLVNKGPSTPLTWQLRTVFGWTLHLKRERKQ